MVPEARFEATETGLVPTGDGWFVLNACDARWRVCVGLGARLSLEGPLRFAQLGVNLFVLPPGETIGLYHWDRNQEDFLVLAGAPLLVVEGEERQLRQWDFVHCPPGTRHIVLNRGDEPCVVLGVGARTTHDGVWGGYPVDEAALRRGVGVERETTDAGEAYARFPERRSAAYRPGWLPGG